MLWGIGSAARQEAIFVVDVSYVAIYRAVLMWKILSHVLCSSSNTG